MSQTAEADWFSDKVATFGDRMAWAREAAGLTQPDLARRLGVKLVTIQGWEEDRAEPRANRLQMMAGMLNVSLRWLLTGQGDGLDAPPGETSVSGDAREILAELSRVRAQMLELARQTGRLEKRLRAELSA